MTAPKRPATRRPAPKKTGTVAVQALDETVSPSATVTVGDVEFVFDSGTPIGFELAKERAG